MAELFTSSPELANAVGSTHNPCSSTHDAIFQQQPLPEYTKNWGPHLYRPAKLPDNYDTRIDPDHIFVFTVHPITGIQRDFYVTPKPCDYCAKVRQLCSRTRPHCARCGAHENARQCVFEEGWVRLPGPKCLKPKRKREDGKDAKISKTRKARATGVLQVSEAKGGTGAEVAGDLKLAEALPSAGAMPVVAGEPTQAELVSEPSGQPEVSTNPPQQTDTSESAEPSPSRASGRYGLRRNPKRSVKVS